MSDSEADTCPKLVVPLLQEAGWDNEPHFDRVPAKVPDMPPMPGDELPPDYVSPLPSQ